VILFDRRVHCSCQLFSYGGMSGSVLVVLCVYSLLSAHVAYESVSDVVRGSQCNHNYATREGVEAYFTGVDRIYGDSHAEGVCVDDNKRCGWSPPRRDLPLLVFAVGLEGSGHQMFQYLFSGVVDCVMKESPHYVENAKQSDTVPFKRRSRMRPSPPQPPFPHATSEVLGERLMEAYNAEGMNSPGGQCRTIYDGLNSFPHGYMKHTGRMFAHPDIVNLQMLDGVLFDIRYIVMVRNTVETVVTSLSRRAARGVDETLRGAESNLVYMEHALRGIPCAKIFIAHYEFIRAAPEAFLEPLTDFLALAPEKKSVLKSNLLALKEKAKLQPDVKSVASDRQVWNIVFKFFNGRNKMWPTFRGDGYKWAT